MVVVEVCQELRRERLGMSQYMALSEPFDSRMPKFPQLFATGVPRRGPSMYELLCKQSGKERW